MSLDNESTDPSLVFAVLNLPSGPAPTLANVSFLGAENPGCRHYARIIQEWQAQARFSSEVSWVGPMILSDARRLLELLAQIDQLEQQIVPAARQSAMATRIGTIPGFGTICSSELAGKIGTLERFKKEASLALYLGMAVLEKSSGKRQGTQRTRQVNRRAKLALMVAVAQQSARSLNRRGTTTRNGPKVNATIKLSELWDATW